MEKKLQNRVPDEELANGSNTIQSRLYVIYGKVVS